MKRLAALFEMSENERRGFLFLSVFMLLMGAVPFIYQLCRPKSDEELVKLSTQVEKILQEEDTKPARLLNSQGGDDKELVKLFRFDPNDLPAARWKALGFSDKQVQVIKNYEAKGGRFRIKSDVAQLYVVSAADYARLAPYIDLPEHVDQPELARSVGETAIPENPSLTVRTFNKSTLRIDLGRADTADLRRLSGIGPVLSERIVKFRNALGGFHSVEQVKEVYGISEELFARIEAQLLLTDTSLNRLLINRLSEAELAKHPYISYKDAQHLVRFREQHGPFRSIEDLKGMHALNAEFLRKIAPYFDFESQ